MKSLEMQPQQLEQEKSPVPFAEIASKQEKEGSRENLLTEEDLEQESVGGTKTGGTVKYEFPLEKLPPERMLAAGNSAGKTFTITPHEDFSAMGLGKVERKYVKTGGCIRKQNEISYDAKGNIDRELDIEHDAKGFPVRAVEKTKEGQTIYVSKFDGAGRLIEQTITKLDARNKQLRAETRTTKYEEQGNEIVAHVNSVNIEYEEGGGHKTKMSEGMSKYDKEKGFIIGDLTGDPGSIF